MNKQEAAKSLKEAVIHQSGKFCPLIKDKCVKDCVCFYKSMVELKDGTYMISVYCDNAMFDGRCNCD